MLHLPHAVAALGLIGSAGLAQSAPPSSSPLVGSLEACRAVTDSSARLSCYDSAVEALVGAASKGDVVVVEREQVRKARRSLFGFSLPNLPFLRQTRDPAEEEVPKEFVSTLQSMGPSGVGRYRFVIEDGEAIWETVDATPAMYGKRGAEVKIRRGALGSYFLKVEGEQWVRARRVR